MRLVRVHQHQLPEHEPRTEEIRQRAHATRARERGERDPQRVLRRLVREGFALGAPGEMVGKVRDERAHVLETRRSTHVRRRRARGGRRRHVERRRVPTTTTTTRQSTRRIDPPIGRLADP